MKKTNRVMTFGITELLPLLSESARNEVLRLAEEQHLELAANPEPGKAGLNLPEWHNEVCAAVRQICDHVSITVLKHVREHMAAMGDDEARDFSSVCFWVHQYFLCKLDAHIASDRFADSYDIEYLTMTNPGQDDNISERTEKQLRAFYIAGYIAGAADMDALPK